MEDVYAEEETPAAAPEAAPEEETASVDAEEEEASGKTAVIDNKVLSPDGEPLKEGDRIILQVVKTFGDESEVRYAKAEAGEEVQPPGGMMDEANAELDTLDQGY